MASELFPIPESEAVGFRYSLSGALGRLSEMAKRSRNNKYLAFGADKLSEHIEYLRESESNEDAAIRLRKFLDIWVKN